MIDVYTCMYVRVYVEVMCARNSWGCKRSDGWLVGDIHAWPRLPLQAG